MEQYMRRLQEQEAQKRREEEEEEAERKRRAAMPLLKETAFDRRKVCCWGWLRAGKGGYGVGQGCRVSCFAGAAATHVVPNMLSD
jgi:hypothetical protein